MFALEIIDNGLVRLLQTAGGFTAIALASRLPSALRSFADFSFTLLIAPWVYIAALCTLCELGGWLLVGWSALGYVEAGVWRRLSGFDVLRLLDVPDVPYSGWASFDAAVTWLLSLYAGPVLILGPAVVLTVVFAVPLFWLRLRAPTD